MTDCTYQFSDWACKSGQLLPAFDAVGLAASPCPSCNTHEFLRLAWQRSQHIAANDPCPFCFGNKSLHSLSFKIAFDAAQTANPTEALKAMEALGIPMCH
jgi:hypothetical protein